MPLRHRYALCVPKERRATLCKKPTKVKGALTHGTHMPQGGGGWFREYGCVDGFR